MAVIRLLCTLLTISLANGMQWDSSPGTYLDGRPAARPEGPPSRASTVSRSTPKLTIQDLAKLFVKHNNGLSSCSSRSETTKPELSSSKPTRIESAERTITSYEEPSGVDSYKSLLAGKWDHQLKWAPEMMSSVTLTALTKESDIERCKGLPEEPYVYITEGRFGKPSEKQSRAEPMNTFPNKPTINRSERILNSISYKLRKSVSSGRQSARSNEANHILAPAVLSNFPQLTLSAKPRKRVLVMSPSATQENASRIAISAVQAPPRRRTIPSWS